MAQLVRYLLTNWKVVSLIPSQGTCLGFRLHWGAYQRQLINVSFSLSFSLPSPLSKNKYIQSVKKKERNLFKNFKKRFYVFIFRERGREGERETSMCGCFSYAPYWGPGLQPRDVP